MLEYFRDGSAQTTTRAVTQRQKLEIERTVSHSRGILTQGQPVLALTLAPLAHGRIATGSTNFEVSDMTRHWRQRKNTHGENGVRSATPASRHKNTES